MTYDDYIALSEEDRLAAALRLMANIAIASEPVGGWPVEADLEIEREGPVFAIDPVHQRANATVEAMFERLNKMRADGTLRLSSKPVAAA